MIKLILVATILFFTACGDTTTKESLPLKRLYLIDAPVNGIDYECGVRKFTTQFYEGQNGVALCRYAPVTFKLGSVVLGHIDKIKDGQSIYPQDLVGVSRDNFENKEVLKLSLLLQSLDNDGHIDHTIEIDEKVKNKIILTSIDKYTFKEVQTFIESLGKKALPLSSVKAHLEEHSGLVRIADLNVSIKDNTSVGSTIALLKMKNSKNISNIKILQGEGSDSFTITPTGNIKVAKALDFKKKHTYFFQIQATNPIGKSNIANVLIKLESASLDNLSFIEKPQLSPSTLFTNQDTYTFTITGRKETEIYIDSIKQEKKMPLSGMLSFKKTILGSDRTEEHAVVLAYANGIKSEPALLTVIKDTQKPVILQDSNIYVQENDQFIVHIPVEDSNKDRGLTYELSGDDAQFFEVSNVGDIEFKFPSNFEIPKDADSNNIYDFTLTVRDKAQNQSSQAYHVHVKDILDSKPIIAPFYQEISDTIPVGSIVGKLLINNGDSPLTSLTLTGEGSENFQLNQDGTIQLLKTLNTDKDYALTVTAVNAFGTTSQTVFIRVTKASQLGKMELGTLRNATVKLIKLNPNNTQELLDVNLTNLSNSFQLRSDLLEDESFYIYEITNGIYADTHKLNHATFRLISKGIWIKQSSKIVKFTPMSEILYDYVAHYVKNDYSQLESKLNASSKILLSKDLNNDFAVDAKDVLIYSDHENKTALYRTLYENSNYKTLVNNMMDNNRSYLNQLFETRVLKEFKEADAFKQVGSFVYYFNAKNGKFYIYDMKNKRDIAELFLETPKYNILDDDEIDIDDFLNQLFADTNAYRPSLRVDLTNSRVYLTNFNYQTFVLDISNLRLPTIAGKFNTRAKSRIMGQVKNNLFIHSYLYDVINSNIDDEEEFSELFNLDDIHNIQKSSLSFALFDTIYGEKSYFWNTSGCDDTSTIALTTRHVNDLLAHIDKPTTFEIDSYFCDEQAYFYNNKAYVYDQSYLEIYSIGETSLVYETLKSIAISKILNIQNGKLFGYYENRISFINVSNVNNPFVERSMPYLLEESFFGESTVLTDNLPIAIRDGYFITSHQVIDLESFFLSSIYTEHTEGIDFTLFEPFKVSIP